MLEKTREKENTKLRECVNASANDCERGVTNSRKEFAAYLSRYTMYVHERANTEYEITIHIIL